MKKITHLLLSVVVLILGVGVANSQDVSNPKGYVQVYDIESDLAENRSGQYQYENDTLVIRYLLWSNQGKMNVVIKNKLKVPIYINWTQSQYTVEGVSIPMTPYEDKLDAKQAEIYAKYKASEPVLTDMDYEWKKQMSNGEDKDKDQVTEIAPGGTFKKSNYYLIPRGGVVQDTACAVELTKHRANKKQKAHIYSTEYTKETTPFTFSAKIVYAANKKTVPSTSVKHNFYVSKVSEMEAKHFRGKKIGKDPEGFWVYKFPEYDSKRCWLEIDRRRSVPFNKNTRY